MVTPIPSIGLAPFEDLTPHMVSFLRGLRAKVPPLWPCRTVSTRKLCRSWSTGRPAPTAGGCYGDLWFLSWSLPQWLLRFSFFSVRSREDRRTDTKCTLFSLQPPSTFCSTLLLGCINCREAWRGVTGNQSCPGVYLGAAESWAPGPALATWFVSRAQPNQRTVLLLRSVHWGFQLESLVSGTMKCNLRETLRCLRLGLEPFPRCAIAFLLVEYPRRPNTFSSEFIYGFPCHFSGARLWTLAYNLLAVLMVFTQISPWGNCVRHLYRASSGNVMLSSLNTAAPAAPFWSEKAWKSLNQLDLLSDGRKSLLALWTSRQVSSAWASPQFHV